MQFLEVGKECSRFNVELILTSLSAAVQNSFGLSFLAVSSLLSFSFIYKFLVSCFGSSVHILFKGVIWLCCYLLGEVVDFSF